MPLPPPPKRGGAGGGGGDELSDDDGDLPNEEMIRFASLQADGLCR